MANKKNKGQKAKSIKKKSVTGTKKIRASDKAWGESKEQLLLMLHRLEIGVVVYAPDTRILFSNPAASRILGLTVEQMRGKAAIDPAWCFVHEEGTPMPLEEYPVNSVISTKKPFHDLIVGINRPSTKDRVWVMVNAFPEFDVVKQLKRIIVTFVDITSRKKAEEKSQHLNRVLLSVRNVNQLITRVTDRAQLIQGACDNLIENRGYYKAWIALFDDNGRVTHMVEAGVGEAFSYLKEFLNRGNLPNCIKKVMKESEIIAILDVDVDCGDCPNSRIYSGGGSLIARLEYAGKRYGFLCVSVTKELAGDKEEQSLFKEVANDIGFALSKIEVEAALKESEKKYRRMIMNLSEGFYSVALDGKLLDHNIEFNNILGFELEENLVGVQLPDFWQYPEERKAYLEELNKHGIIKNYPIAAKKRNGEKIFVEAYARLIKDHQGQPARIEGAFINITKSKQNEELLRQSEHELRIRNNVANIFLVYSEEEMYDEILKIVLEVMNSPYGVFGYLDENAALVVPTMTRFVWEKCQVPEKNIVFPRASWGDSSWPQAIIEKRIIHSNKPSTNIPEGHISITRHISLPIIHQGNAIGLLQVANKETDYNENDIRLFETIGNSIAPVLHARLQRDLQEREREKVEDDISKLNEELEHRVLERTAELEAANKELEAFAYSVSHDLRSPLRSIDGFCQIILEDYAGKLDGKGTDYFQRVRAASQRMSQLIDDILKISRATRAEMHRETVDLSAIVRKKATELQTTNPERQVVFLIAPDVMVEGDMHLLGIVVENLLSNAWKFTGKHPSAKVEFGITKKGAKTAYFVKDDGAGFDMAYVSKLFAPFQRLHSMQDFSGTGIGLATILRIIRRHGGEVWAEGEPGKGATFYFTLD